MVDQKTIAKTYTLTQLNQSVTNWVRDTFGSRTYWISCEVAKANLKGVHWYLELADSNVIDETTAKSSASIWRSNTLSIAESLKAYGVQPEEILKQGNRVRIKVRVTFHNVYGLKLDIEEVDALATIGDLEKQKQETLKRIKKEGLETLQKQLYLSPLATRIAIVGSPDTSGFIDFVKELTTNNYFTRFKYKTFPTKVQGDEAVSQIVSAINEASNYDVEAIVIIRGGGSKMDLHVFNHYAICKAIAYSRVPVITGIGHETDTALVDVVSYESLKTPTAAAKRFYLKIATFRAELSDVNHRIRLTGTNLIGDCKDELNYFTGQLVAIVNRKLSKEKDKLHNRAINLNLAVRELLELEKNNFTGVTQLFFQKVSIRLVKAKENLWDVLSGVKTSSQQMLSAEINHINVIQERLVSHPKKLIEFNHLELENSWALTILRIEHFIRNDKDALGFEIDKLKVVDPSRLFEKGYTISTVSGKDINIFKEELLGKEMTTYSNKFEIKSTIKKIKKND